MTPMIAPPRKTRDLRFGQLLCGHRTRKGITQLELSLRAGVSVRHISFLERGRARPSEFMIQCLSQAMGLGAQAEDQLRAAVGLLPRHAHPRRPEAAGAADGHLAQHVFEIAARLEEARRPADLIELSEGILRRLGIEYFFCGTLTPTAPLHCAISFDAEGRFPSGWLDHYREHGHRPHDPLVRETLGGRSAFFWSDVLGHGQLAAREQRVIDEAREFGIRGGFVVSLRQQDGSLRAVSMMGDPDTRDHDVRLALRTTGICLLDAHERVCGSYRAPELGAETLEALRWTLEDRSQREIADRRGVPTELVAMRLRTACDALGVREAHQATARAVALRLI